jgi:O-antigen chain-terminating methyltransferase
MWLGELAGPEARSILARQYEAYWPWLERIEGPVLDVGCGAGEWLAFLGRRGKQAVGIDSNPHEVERCRKAGLDAHRADAFDWLKEHPGRYGAITLFQVIEHIPRERLHEFLLLLAGALREGGLLVMETVNPAHALALSIFYNDPTHQRPLPLEYLGFVCQGAGLRPLGTVYTYPVSVAVTGADWQATHYLNYAVVLRKP